MGGVKRKISKWLYAFSRFYSSWFRTLEAPANLIAEIFIIGQPKVLILGDNPFFGYNLRALVGAAATLSHSATVFRYAVIDPEPYVVVAFDAHGRAVSLEKKERYLQLFAQSHCGARHGLPVMR